MSIVAPPFARLVLAPNPGPMTLDGTNTWLLSAGGGPVVVVDPGPPDRAHLEAIAAHGEVALVLLTHGHLDHSEGAPLLHDMVGAPVLAVDPALCRVGDPLMGGQVLESAGVRVEVLSTPGHSADSVSFLVSVPAARGTRDDAGATAVLTGDTVLGRGTTVVAHPEGRLDDYLVTLALLRDLGPLAVLPGHGPVRPDLAAVAAEYLAHRAVRLEQVRTALAGGAVTADEVVDAVYADVDPAVRFAALMSVQAQLAYLAARD